jgi:Ca2+-binding EF-hand superfamily protein
MTNREMTRDEVVKHVRELFTKLDGNRDGYVTREEAGSFHDKVMGGMHAGMMHGDMEKRLAVRGIHVGDRGAMFDRLDTNKDGNISRQEFTTAQPQMRQERVIVMRDGTRPGGAGAPGKGMRMHRMGGMGFGGRMFEMADTNKDGRVSLAEAQTAALSHFDSADTNHDGKITPDERRNIRMMRMERRGS